MIPALKSSHRPSIFVTLFALLVSVSGALLFSCCAQAQSAEEAAKIAANLKPEAQTVIARLSAISNLPSGTWKMHSGDLAHGEAVKLDESSWQSITPRSEAPNDAVWFRQTYNVPVTLSGYDLTGSRIWFQFHAEANGPMPEILYFNGRRVAMGDDLEPVVLFDDAKPGDKVTVAIKLLHTVDKKTFRGATLRIEFPESRPNPEDLRLEFLSAALLVPSLAPKDASQMTTLNDSIRAVDLSALDAAAAPDAAARAQSQRGAPEARSPQAAPRDSHFPSHGQLAHRRRMALALD
jgi:alpha-mannosidase